MASAEFGSEVQRRSDPMWLVLYYAGRESYLRMIASGTPEDIHFDERNRFWVSLDGIDSPEQVPSKALQVLKGVKGRCLTPGFADYAPEDRVKAYIKGFGLVAAEMGDVRTATAALDVLLSKENTRRQEAGESITRLLERA